MRKRESLVKSRMLRVRLSFGELSALKRAANAREQDLSTFVRNAALAAAATTEKKPTA